ncbi:hypothetical protein HA050_02105 [Iodobacter sp. HSC-16F04]|uniref:Transcriptional regulator n=1 Tax=Iodobacter violaceini TaxID=3044271 RepID=A0ABX0KS50_9NEIS|nr:hypothetical protein [Iodobacter violacea]NHQ84904.1 hypothetical protein [Iodobacter violacea]
MAVEIHCPYCNSKTHTRTSVRITPTATTAQIGCRCCGARLKVGFQITEARVAKYSEDHEVFKWTDFPPSNDPKFKEQQLTLAL